MWTGYTNKAGYGRIHDGDENWKPVYAHRVSWNLAHPEDIASNGWNGDIICHSCDNPTCVNPNHLWKGTHIDNIHDMMRKGRMNTPGSPGSRNGRAKLTEADIPKILNLRKQGLKYGELARLFNVSHSSISDILNGRHWRHAV